MDWTAALDGYCERLGPGFWAEPANAITNASFIAAAVVGTLVALRRNRLDAGVGLLIAITAAVGIGSFLFHTIATRWAGVADVIPIQLFIVAYMALVMRRFVGLPWSGAALATAAFVAFSAGSAAAVPPSVRVALNGSDGYLPPLVALFVVGAALRIFGRRGPAAPVRQAGAALIVAAAIFSVSLAFRTVDMTVCDAFPLGTHFVWHSLNGVLLGWLIVAMVRFGDRAPRR